MKGQNNKKGVDKTEDELNEKIKKLEERIEELEKEEKHIEEFEKEKKRQPSIVEGIVGQFIPGLSNIVKALEHASPEFKKRIAETDTEIQHRIETGWSSKPVVSYSISTRPLSSQHDMVRSRRSIKKPETFTEKIHEKEPIFDVFDEKEYITVIAELPGVEEKDLEITLTGRTIEISAGNFSKTIVLPAAGKSVIQRTFKHGILRLKIEREENAR